jgi:hypothetical protein
MILGDRLMPTAPLRPRQDVAGGLLHSQDQAPQQAADLRHAQGDRSPRPALKAARLRRSWGGGRLFFNASTAIVPARRTVNKASAHMASVICRYHPVQLRTS